MLKSRYNLQFFPIEISIMPQMLLMPRGKFLIGSSDGVRAFWCVRICVCHCPSFPAVYPPFSVFSQDREEARHCGVCFCGSGQRPSGGLYAGGKVFGSTSSCHRSSWLPYSQLIPLLLVHVCLCIILLDPYECVCVCFQCLANAADGVRLAARIVDTPCSEMNTDDFLEASVYPRCLDISVKHCF